MSNPEQMGSFYMPENHEQSTEAPQQMPTRAGSRMAAELKKYKRRSRILAITTCVLAVTTLAFGGIVIAAEVITVKENHSSLSKVYDVCKDVDKGTLSLGDRNNTLTVEESGGLEAYSCVASTLPIPKATQAKIGATNGFSGTQTDTWDGFKATWSYNKNNGLDLVIQKN